jgi:hypothetical protein
LKLMLKAYWNFAAASHNPEDYREEKACVRDGEGAPASLNDLVLAYDWIGLGACASATFVVLQMSHHKVCAISTGHWRSRSTLPSL